MKRNRDIGIAKNLRPHPLYPSMNFDPRGVREVEETRDFTNRRSKSYTVSRRAVSSAEIIAFFAART